MFQENTLDLGDGSGPSFVDDDEPFPAPVWPKRWKKLGFEWRRGLLSPLALRSPQHGPRPCRWLSALQDGNGFGCGRGVARKRPDRGCGC